MVLMVVFWVILIFCALGGGWYWRTQPYLPGFGALLVLIAILGFKVMPPG